MAKPELPDWEKMEKYTTHKRMPMGTKVTDEFYECFRYCAASQGISISSAMREALYEWAQYQMEEA